MIKLAQAIINEFTHSIGMGSVVFEDDGFCQLLVNQEVVVKIKCDDENERMIFIGEIKDTLPDNLSKSQFNHLLSQTLTMMHGHGPSLGWDSEIGLIGFKHLPMSILSLTTFERTLADFLDWLNANPIRVELDNNSSSNHVVKSSYMRG